MATKFDDLTVREALERAIKNAPHLRAIHHAAIQAARALADKIDNWDTIVDWAMEDADEVGGRPLVPANDNVSIPSFLKYVEALGLLPPKEAVVPRKAEKPKDELAAFRSKHGVAS